MWAKNWTAKTPDDLTTDIIETAESISLDPVDEARAVPRPDTIEEPWHQREYDEYAAEQPDHAAADGELASRPASVRASGLKEARDGAADARDFAKQDCVDARAVYRAIVTAFGKSRRPADAKFWYQLRWFLLLTGDIAGVTGAAVMYGELVYLAVMQAVASAVAAVTAGQVGEDIRVMRDSWRRQRDPDQLTDVPRPYAYLFRGGDPGEQLVKVMLWVALSVALLVFGGILALRAGAEDGLAGIVFGCLAGAVCAASAINSYFYADEAADLLDRAWHDVVQADKRLAERTQAPVFVAYGEAAATVASIKAEYGYLGRAGQRHFKGLAYGITRRHPGIFGHGPAAPPSSPFPELEAELRR
jgi:hypothetical protein